jgi:hypothetical protein
MHARSGSGGISALFGTPPHMPPPPPKVEAARPPPTTKVEQYTSSVLPQTEHRVPPPPTPSEPASVETLLYGVRPPRAPRRPTPPPVERVGPPRTPETKAEMQISYILGGDPDPAPTHRHRASKNWLRVEFDGLQPEEHTPRLFAALEGLPLEHGIKIGKGTVKVKKDPLLGEASGRAEAEFRHVPDRARLERVLDASRASGALKARSAKVVYDDSRTIVQAGDGEVIRFGVPDDRLTTTARAAYRDFRFVDDAAVPESVVKEDAAARKAYLLRDYQSRRDQTKMRDRRV